MTDPASPPSALSRHGAVVLGSVAGALLRHGQGALFAWLVPGVFPWGTFTINVAGSIALCAFLGALSGASHPLWRPFFAVGFCGTYTTFSSFENETLLLVSTRRAEVALVYVLASVLVGIATGFAAWRLVEETRRVQARLGVRPPLALAPILALVAAGVIIAAIGRFASLEAAPLAAGCGAVVAGGVLGALARYVVATVATDRLGTFFPWGTFIINVSGSFAIGLYEGLSSRPDGLSPLLRLFFVTGVCGGYTTFSTFAAETLALARDRGGKRALANVLGSVLVGFGAVFAGRALGRFLVG